ncbi:MAG TPA: rhomboid family intramembrane serine protease [Cyclobacteriaceae bacterium]|nr:rhomboid family intramembrane serine protease [Cyclobacteriaceae bacterium]
MRDMGKFNGAVAILIIINIIFFIITFAIPGMENPMFEAFALYFPKNEHFGVWQFVTNMFMHGGYAHILFNMYALWAFGSPLEEMWGKSKFLFFYFVSGIGASIIYTLVNYYQFSNIYNELIATGISADDIQHLLETRNYNQSLFSGITEEKLRTLFSLYSVPAVGASGAIYGVLVAFGILFPNAKLALIFLPVPIAAKYFIPILIGLDLFSGVTGISIFGGGVAHFAHVGGAIIGFLLMWYWRKKGYH